MAERGRKPKEYPPGKRPVYVTIMITEEALNLLPKDKSRSKAIEHAIYITYGKPSKLQYDELIIQREKLVEKLEEAMEHQRQIEKEVSEIQNQIQYIDNRLKELDDTKKKEMDGLNFAVFVLRKAIHNAVKSNMKLQKEEFFNEIGIKFNYKQFNNDFHRDYGEILTLSNEEMIQRYNIKFTENNISNKKAYENYYSEYKSSESNKVSLVKESNPENKVENKIEFTNTTNNLSVSSNVNEIQEGKNEIKESESNIENIDITNETIQDNERGQVNFTSTGEQIKQENKESKGEYIPNEELIKQEVKKRLKIGKFTIFEDLEDIYNDLKVHNIIEKREGSPEIKFYKTQTPHYISFKLPKKFNEYTEDQQKYLKDNFDVYAFSPSDPVEIIAYVKKEGE